MSASPAAATPQGPAAADASVVSTSDDGLRTFTIEKPASEVRKDAISDTTFRSPIVSPRDHDALRTTIGVGYVEGADWGTELMADGGFGGLQVEFGALLTQGSAGTRLDRGSLSVFDPDRKWQFEAGDLFTNLRGASRGARISWHMQGHHPALSLYGPRLGLADRTTVLAFRDQIQVRSQTLLDGEVTTNGSYLIGTRLGSRRFDFETMYRSTRVPLRSSDISASGGIVLWHGVRVTTGSWGSRDPEHRGTWNDVSVRVPFSRAFSLTLERAFANSSGVAMATSAAMVNGTVGGVQFFHRYQTGRFDYVQTGSSVSVDRQQTQSMASYQRSRRVNLTLQLATQHTETGQTQTWEELQTTLNLTKGTVLQTATPVPDVTDPARMRVSLRQSLGGPFSLQAEYGRLSTFQPVPSELDRSRFKLMVYATHDIGTPARGADVQGRVIDQTGRPVPGVRVKLGPYSADTDRTGHYRFRDVPAGQYVLSLDAQFIPADYAWDGREVPLTLRWSSHFVADLLVAPFNAVHGRVYCDRNGNGRFDEGEGVASVPVYLSDRVTATDQNGGFSFYNVTPGPYVARIDTDKLPSGFQAGDIVAMPITANDGQPVTGVDFRVKPYTKPIVWQDAEHK